MEEILLIDRLKEKFDKEFNHTLLHYIHSKNNFDELSKIIKKEPMTIFGMSMNVWNRIVQFKLRNVNPRALADDVDEQNPEVHRKISRIIGEPTLKEVLYSEMEINDPALKYKCINEIMVGIVFPNDIHLADIEFSNPYEPIEKSNAKSPNQNFKGLGLLHPQIDKLIEYGKKNNCGYLTLTASTKNEYEMFKKYGFQLEDNEVARMGVKIGYGISMEIKINGYYRNITSCLNRQL